MEKKTKKSTKTKTKTIKTKNLVMFVENSTPKGLLFSNKKLADSFIASFRKHHPTPDDGYWVDMLITNISGDILVMDSFCNIETA